MHDEIGNKTRSSAVANLQWGRSTVEYLVIAGEALEIGCHHYLQFGNCSFPSSRSRSGVSWTASSMPRVVCHVSVRRYPVECHLPLQFPHEHMDSATPLCHPSGSNWPEISSQCDLLSMEAKWNDSPPGEICFHLIRHVSSPHLIPSRSLRLCHTSKKDFIASRTSESFAFSLISLKFC